MCEGWKRDSACRGVGEAELWWGLLEAWLTPSCERLLGASELSAAVPCCLSGKCALSGCSGWLSAGSRLTGCSRATALCLACPGRL